MYIVLCTFFFFFSFFVALISTLALLKDGNLGITRGLKQTGDLPTGAAIYGMRIVSLHSVVLHTCLKTRPTNN